MNETKHKILIKSLALFNTFGISNVSLRTIADEVGISVGNLQYHFKQRENIIEEHYYQLVEKIDHVTLKLTDDSLKAFLNISVEIFSILYEYHFFLLDFVMITRNNQKIKKHYSELSKRREDKFLIIVNDLVKNGLLREESLKNEYLNLYKRTEVISNFLFSSALIHSKDLSKECISEYSLLIGQSIYPYLTDEAKNEYIKIFPT